jgi:predicted phage replisome organizer
MPDGDTLVVTWFQILCLAGEVNDNGMIYITHAVPYTEETLASAFDTPIATIRLALDTFEHLGMIERFDSFLCVSNWEKYQNIEGLSKIREQGRIRKQRQRAKQLLPPACHVTSRDSHATDIDIDIEEEESTGGTGGAKAPPRDKKFVPPTLEEVAAYCTSRKNGIDPQKFIDFYESKGWMIGKNKMKSWQAAVRTWEGKRREEQPPAPAPHKRTEYRTIIENGKEVDVPIE